MPRFYMIALRKYGSLDEMCLDRSSQPFFVQVAIGSGGETTVTVL